MPRPFTPLDLLLELQQLDRVPRSGYALRGVPHPESVSEHSFHLAFLVWALSATETDVDRFRAVELALLHDLAEVRLGDLPRSASHYLPAGAKPTAEAAIADDLLGTLGTEAVERFREYQAKETTEARFVGQCDLLQLLLKAHTYRRSGVRGLEEFWTHLPELRESEFASIRGIAIDLQERAQDDGQTTEDLAP